MDGKGERKKAFIAAIDLKKQDQNIDPELSSRDERANPPFMEWSKKGSVLNKGSRWNRRDSSQRSEWHPAMATLLSGLEMIDGEAV